MEHLQKTNKRHQRRTAYAAMKERNHFVASKKKNSNGKVFKICDTWNKT